MRGWNYLLGAILWDLVVNVYNVPDNHLEITPDSRALDYNLLYTFYQFSYMHFWENTLHRSTQVHGKQRVMSNK